ncbi:APC family permease [Gulosibacter sp. ACHW.36C]|uniref:APC family permease n=1 Tax=Gulosibacter sediminis TaxID=1729695 RepID=A0ABY4MXY1_9MICO|nr:APC family permease [Gulosibacter sediminis]UQN15290.1 APC family permease [Gulosibacter sediminis]
MTNQVDGPITTAIKGPSSKGLSVGKVGVIGGAVIGVSTIAPAYTLTSGLGPTVSEVGLQTPAILLIGFIPMLLVLFGYRELNMALPDSGTSFTWATRAFGPIIGWMTGWGLVSATILVLSNLAAVATDFFFILLAQISGNSALSDIPSDHLFLNIVVTTIFVALAAWIGYRGIETTERVQWGLVVFQLIALVWYSVAAITSALGGDAFDATPVDVSWFNPFEVGDLSVVIAGVSLSIFMFWGWDTVITMNEETKDPKRTPGRAATVTIITIVMLYLLVTVATLMWAGVGDEGLGAGNPKNQESIFAVLAPEVMGPFAILMSIAILTSSLASLQSTMVSPARTMLAMGFYEAMPKSFAKISPRFKSPGVATFVAATASIVFYVVMRLVSENALWDTITALGMMVCFYYGATGLAAVWYFRRSWFTSVRNFFMRFLLPLAGGATLVWMFVQTCIDSIDPEYGSGSSIGGLGLVFVLGIGVLLLGVVLMIVMRLVNPRYFRGETLEVSEYERDKVEGVELLPE